jgi:hypothetical protein
MSQTVLKQMPPGITPPLILSFNASSVPILQLALSSDKLSETQIFDSALNFIRPGAGPGSLLRHKVFSATPKHLLISFQNSRRRGGI